MIKIFQTLIKNFFNAFLWAFLNNIVKNKGAEVLSMVSTVAKNTEWSDEAKRKEAFSQLKLYFINLGIDVKDSAINLAIEIAVQVWKARK